MKNIPAPAVFHCRVEDLDALLELLLAEGVRIDGEREQREYCNR